MEQDETIRARCDALHEQIVTAMKELIRLHQCDRIAIPINGSSPTSPPSLRRTWSITAGY